MERSRLGSIAGWHGMMASLCLWAACGGVEAPKPTSAALGPRPLAENRDRLLQTLAQLKGTTSCDLWSRLTANERYTFMVQSKVLSHSDSYIYPPDRTVTLSRDGSDCTVGCTIICDGYSTYCYPQCPGSGWPAQVSPEQCLCAGDCYATYQQRNTETLLDHATNLYTINPSDGSCGGGDQNRIYVGFDDTGKWAVRNYTIAGGRWVTSDDCAGPHGPFNAREDIDWGSAFCGFRFQHNGPTRHHWQYDYQLQSLCSRMGVGRVTDPSVTEVTTSYNWLHDADPTCIYGGIPGYQKVEDRMGPAEYGWMPSGCGYTPPAPFTTYAGVGPGC